MKRILVVDDHPLMIKFLTGHFEKAGHEVVTARDGLSALQLLETYVPEVAFIDYVMPNINGEKLCRVIRSRQDLSSCFIVILSAIVVEEQLSTSDVAADLLLAKGPFDRLSYYLDFILWHLEEGCENRIRGMVAGQDEVLRTEITKELLDSARHTERILNYISEGLLELVDGSTIIYANPAAASIIGKPEQELLSADFTDLFQEPDRAYIHNQMTAAAAGQKEAALEKTLDMNHKQVHIRVIPVLSQSFQKNLLVLLRDLA
jgi:CheY-like chemotaxis protein